MTASGVAQIQQLLREACGMMKVLDRYAQHQAVSDFLDRAEAALLAVDAPQEALQQQYDDWYRPMFKDSPDNFNAAESVKAVAVDAPPPQAEEPWQDISTAPKDGTQVLLYGRFVDESVGPSLRAIGLWFQGYSDRGWWVVSALPFTPAYWMPLSAPPRPTRQEGS